MDCDNTLQTSILTIEDIQDVAVSLLDVIDAFCKKNGIRYYLLGGSLIGAVRDHDLIPWDDDLDICMLRPDYDRFVKLFQETEEYGFYSYERTSGYRHVVAKVVDKNTVCVEQNDGINTLREMSVDYGVFVDVFPLDFVPKQDSIITKLGYLLLRFGKTTYIRSDSVYENQPVKQFRQRVLHIFERIVPFEKYMTWMDNRFRSFSGPFVANFRGAWKEKEVGRREWFDQSIDCSVRDKVYPIPCGYHAWLSRVYGDYMTPPVSHDDAHGVYYHK